MYGCLLVGPILVQNTIIIYLVNPIRKVLKKSAIEVDWPYVRQGRSRVRAIDFHSVSLLKPVSTVKTQRV